MSEGSPEGTGAGTAPESPEGSASGTGAEDAEASRLLGGMLESDPDELQRQLDHWKEQARKHEKRAKENSGAAARLQQLEDANKTEIQRAQDAAAEAIRERDAARADHARVMAAAAHNLPVELIDHLGPGTDEEINERAELFGRVIETSARAIADEILNQQGAGASRNGSPGARPVESMRAGSAPSTGGMPKTSEEWFRALVTGE